jgi:hypothetical protein
LAVRSSNPHPENPVEALKDYFGQVRDPMWDNMDQWKEENASMGTKIPELKQKIEEITL